MFASEAFEVELEFGLDTIQSSSSSSSFDSSPWNTGSTTLVVVS